MGPAEREKQQPCEVLGLEERRWKSVVTESQGARHLSKTVRGRQSQHTIVSRNGLAVEDSRRGRRAERQRPPDGKRRRSDDGRQRRSRKQAHRSRSGQAIAGWLELCQFACRIAAVSGRLAQPSSGWSVSGCAVRRRGRVVLRCANWEGCLGWRLRDRTEAVDGRNRCRLPLVRWDPCCLATLGCWWLRC